jgi:hypothetical protein
MSGDMAKGGFQGVDKDKGDLLTRLGAIVVDRLLDIAAGSLARDDRLGAQAFLELAAPSSKSPRRC